MHRHGRHGGGGLGDLRIGQGQGNGPHLLARQVLGWNPREPARNFFTCSSRYQVGRPLIEGLCNSSFPSPFAPWQAAQTWA